MSSLPPGRAMQILQYHFFLEEEEGEPGGFFFFYYFVFDGQSRFYTQ